MLSPMCQYSADDGCASDWHLMHLGKFAVSGVGLIMIEATHVEARGRITPRCLGLYSDETEVALARVVKFCRDAGQAKIGVQLSHAGRKGSAKLPWLGRGRPLSADEGAWQCVGASDIPFDRDWSAPLPLDAAGLKTVKQAHIDAARRCVAIGIDLIEFHVAHGYLFHEFLSPLTNRRTDQYGGSPENRMRFPLEVFAAIRAVCPALMPIGVRVSATDHVDGGWNLEETIAFAKVLKKLGCDYINVSSGGLSTQQKISVGEGYQIPLARAVRNAVQMPTTGVGMIYRPEHAEALIRDGNADLVALGRTLLYDPHWVWYAASVLGADTSISYPSQYIRGYKSEWLRNNRRTAEHIR